VADRFRVNSKIVDSGCGGKSFAPRLSHVEGDSVRLRRATAFASWDVRMRCIELKCPNRVGIRWLTNYSQNSNPAETLSRGSG